MRVSAMGDRSRASLGETFLDVANSDSSRILPDPSYLQTIYNLT